MEAHGKLLLRSGAVAFLFVFVVLGSVVFSPAAAARQTVGFPPEEAADREAATGAVARPREMASVGRDGAGVAENGRVKAGEKYYASLLLNALPRGQTPPSGPSPQINYVKT